MKDAVIAAAEIAGKKRPDKTGKYIRPGPDGLTGFMLHLALHNEAVFGANMDVRWNEGDSAERLCDLGGHSTPS
jgi:hypothetical protein